MKKEDNGDESMRSPERGRGDRSLALEFGILYGFSGLLLALPELAWPSDAWVFRVPVA